MDDFYKNLGQLIKEKRIEKNLTTQELADTLGVSIGFLSNLENSKTDTFNVELMSKLENTLGIPVINFIPITNDDILLTSLFSPKDLERTHNNVMFMLSNNINMLVTEYISIIKCHNYEPSFINKMTKKLLEELKYIDDFKLK